MFFRDSARRVAETLKLTGHAINLPNGDVEVLACGDAEALDKFAAWLAEGPPLADVTEVVASDATAAGIIGFRVG